VIVAAACRIIIHLSAVHIRNSPLRTLRAIGDDEEPPVVPQIEEEVNEMKWEEAIWDPVVGSGCRLGDFRVGMKVQFRHNDEWWSGSVHYVSASRGTLSIRPVGEANSLSGYLPMHVRPHA
jgi:hypothetical protein